MGAEITKAAWICHDKGSWPYDYIVDGVGQYRVFNSESACARECVGREVPQSVEVSVGRTP